MPIYGLLCPIEHTGQGFDIEAWRDHFLVPMQRLAAAVHERVAYALVPNFHEEDTVAIARKYLLEQKNVSTLLASLLTTEPEAAKPEVILAGPEVAEIKGHIASTALLLTEAGSETSKDYDPEILIWSLALPESDLSARAALELGHRFDCHELDHKDIYSRLGLLPLDIYHYHLWRHLNSNVIYSISQPEYLGELYRFLRAKSNSQDAVALGHYGHTVSSLIQGIELVESLIEQRIAQIEAEAVPQELTKKMQQALREKGKAEESMTHLLCRLYWVEGMSRGEIARQLGVTLMTIVNWMDQLKIPGKNRLAASRAVISLDDYHQRITREHEEKIMARLVDKFGQNPLEEIRSRLNKRATLQELAKEVGIVAETFSRWLRQLGFEKPNLPKRSGRIDSYRLTYAQAFAEGILEKIASQEVIQALQLYFNQERSIPEIAKGFGIERYSDALRQRMLSALVRAAKLLESKQL